MRFEGIPRCEYPRPQFVRERWLCLNGTWRFEIDRADSGLDRGLLDRELTSEILVPFCPESSLSGIGDTDFMNAVWYRREVRVPSEWEGRRTLLHFQAVDYDAAVWANGVLVGRHRGGFTPFTCDLSCVAKAGDVVTIVVRARDPRGQAKPCGKQAIEYANSGCLYTRTTGIWQTVWMEPVPMLASLRRPTITPSVSAGTFRLIQPLAGDRSGMSVRAVLRDGRGEVARAEVGTDHEVAPSLDLPVPQDRRRLWSPEDPFLYELDIELVSGDGEVIDRAASYAGLRSVSVAGNQLLLNGKPRFQKLVLDQGYWPDGIMTAPSDESLARDIELSLAAGFNGARLHQKVFEERFLYHADRLGYLVWAEFGDWGWRAPEYHGRDSATYSEPQTHQSAAALMTQWLETLHRDYSHPSIIGWCGLNECFGKFSDSLDSIDDAVYGAFLAAKAMDHTRPVLDASGYSHRVAETDVYDSHDYEQDPSVFRSNHAGTAGGKPFVNRGKGFDVSIPYAGQPYIVSEFGGARWNPAASPEAESWGYGKGPSSEQEFLRRFEGLVSALLDNPAIAGYCYTQLTDVFQEQNGLYAFDRSAKFDVEKLVKAQHPEQPR